MRLRRSVVTGPGLHRVRRGKGSPITDAEGRPVTDKKTLNASTTSSSRRRGRRCGSLRTRTVTSRRSASTWRGASQYLYHQQWQEERNEEKFDRVLEMSKALPDMRRQIAADLRGRGLTRDRVLALALHLLDLGYFRAGGEQYAEENNSFGIATLLCEHVTVQRDAVEFDFPAKSGVRRTRVIDDPEVVRSVRALMRRPERTDRLLVCRNTSGWLDIHADDLNARFKELVGDEFTVKDMRTWHGTVLAAAAFVDADPPANRR